MAESHKYEVVSYDNGNFTVGGTITVKDDNSLEFEPKSLKNNFEAVFIPTLRGELSLEDGQQFIEAYMHLRNKSGYTSIREAKE